MDDAAAVTESVLSRPQVFVLSMARASQSASRRACYNSFGTLTDTLWAECAYPAAQVSVWRSDDGLRECLYESALA